MRRDVYGKRELRANILRPAWQVGDRKSFVVARAQALSAILRDLKLSSGRWPDTKRGARGEMGARERAMLRCRAGRFCLKEPMGF